MIKLIVLVSKEGALSTLSGCPCPKVYFCIVQFWKLAKKQGKIIGNYKMQLPTVDSRYLEIYPLNHCREVTLVTPIMSDALKVLDYDVRARYMAFLYTLGSIF